MNVTPVAARAEEAGTEPLHNHFSRPDWYLLMVQQRPDKVNMDFCGNVYSFL
jgi:hypothetical protein